MTFKKATKMYPVNYKNKFKKIIFFKELEFIILYLFV